jgi:hypothetical protein
MRPGVRSKVKSALAVLVFSAWGLALHVPMALDANTEAISPRVKMASLVPGAALFALSFLAAVGTATDAACLLRVVTTLGFSLWPVGVAPFAFFSVGGLWTLACRFPESLPVQGASSKAMFFAPTKHLCILPRVSISWHFMCFVRRDRD